MKIDTQPTSASVVASSGEEIGHTPLSLEGEGLQKALGGRSFLELTLTKEGYSPARLLIEPKSFENLNVTLTPENDSAFRDHVLKSYADQTNKMTISLLEAQGALGSRRIELADRLIADLEKNYPTLAAAFVLEGDLRMAQAKKSEAIKAFKQAQKLAPNEIRIQRSLEALTKAPPP